MLSLYVIHMYPNVGHFHIYVLKCKFEIEKSVSKVNNLECTFEMQIWNAKEISFKKKVNILECTFEMQIWNAKSISIKSKYFGKQIFWSKKQLFRKEKAQTSARK